MIGAIAGDIIGSVYEFDQIKSTEFELFGDYHGEKCDFTDDTVMTIAVAAAVMRTDVDGDWSKLGNLCSQYMHRLGELYPDRGYGERFGMWLFLDDPIPYNSFGNGAAMRVSPVAYAATSLDEALTLSDRVTEITHNHPEGLKGARATTACIFLAHQGADKNTIRNYVENNFYALDFTIDGIRKQYRFNESCQKTVPQAIQAFLEAENYEETIRLAVSLGGDSDTLACIAGSIAEAFYEVPASISQRAREYLPKELLQIVDAFEARYQNRPGLEKQDDSKRGV